MRIIAVEAAAVGNVTVNVLELEDLFDPKSNTATAGFVPPAEYINAPRAVIVELVHVALEKSTYAVVSEVVVVGVIATPPAV
jgi:hypothetical protein